MQANGQGRIIAASYERVSTGLQARHGFSLAAQHSSLEEFADANGWLLPSHLRFRDTDSGAKWDLAGLTEMLEAARQSQFEVLVVPDLDRFARTMIKGLVLEEQLRKYGVRVAYQRVPIEDTPEGRLLKNQLFSIAEYEREKILLRTFTGKRQKALSGKVVGQSVAPYGYRYTYNDRGKPEGIQPDPVTSEVVRGMFRELLRKSCDEVAEGLNAAGVPTPRARKWAARSVYRIAFSPTYIGMWHFGDPSYSKRVPIEDRGGIMVPVPPLVDRSVWDRVQMELERRKVKRRPQNSWKDDPYILRGMLTCGHCHGALAIDNVGGHRYYQCIRHRPGRARKLGKPTCDLPSIRSEPLEEILWNHLCATLLDGQYLAAGLDAARSEHEQADQLRHDRIATIENEIKKHRQRLDNLTVRLADIEEGEVFQSVLRRAKEIEDIIRRLTVELGALRALRSAGLSQSEAKAITDFAEEIRQGLVHATPAERHMIYEQLDIRGTVYADPNGIKITRRARFRIDWQAVIPLRNNETSLTSSGIPS